MFYTYILKSLFKSDEIYVGSTNDLVLRLRQHNSGKVLSTKRYKPWKLIYYEAFILEELCRLREHNFKYNGNTIRELKKRIGLTESGAGFTLIELVIVIAMLAVISTVAFTVLDPGAQLNKARDATRLHDLGQVRDALDTYYNDNKCYPQTLYGNSALTSGSNPYMTKIPTDPTYTGSKADYAYIVPPGNCPQWMVLFSKLSKAPATTQCGLSSLSNCLPSGYDSTYACVYSGDVSCSQIPGPTP